MSFVGRELQDPSGLRLGHVTAVEADGTGGLYLIVHGDWGALDWLHVLGSARHETHLFRFHSSDVEDTGAGPLRVKSDIAERARRRRPAG